MFKSLLAAIGSLVAIFGPTTIPSTRPSHPQFAIQDRHLVVLGDNGKALSEYNFIYFPEANGDGTFRMFSINVGPKTIFIDARWLDAYGYSHINLTQTENEVTIDAILSGRGVNVVGKDFSTLYRYLLFRRSFNEGVLSFWHQSDFIDTALLERYQDQSWQPTKELTETFRVALLKLNDPSNLVRREGAKMIYATGDEGVIYIFRKLNMSKLSVEQRNWIASAVTLIVLPEDVSLFYAHFVH